MPATSASNSAVAAASPNPPHTATTSAKRSTGSASCAFSAVRICRRAGAGLGTAQDYAHGVIIDNHYSNCY